MRRDLDKQYDVNKVTSLQNDLKNNRKLLRSIRVENDTQRKMIDKNDHQFHRMNSKKGSQSWQLNELAQEEINKKQELKRLQKSKQDDERIV